ncbi:hypothetical protein Nepgr_016534 [Nepenthes gracilis]|uniref:Hydroxyproline-rich glycoprotein family protein n=1 Tax=Nepenthes gracilis TaxID=150966 RepID=A0AAD3SNQ4_NEPGR|nr:hypothetical protein Nepgr_016534 [Nepenthes gracilis]
MESPEYAPVSHADASRPSLGFPLGTALLLLVIFTLSGIFSCCYHWDKLSSLRRSFSDPEAAAADLQGDGQVKPPCHSIIMQEKCESVTVVMPGDNIAKFIAQPCPRQPLHLQKLATVPPPEKLPKPPRFPVPLY